MGGSASPTAAGSMSESAPNVPGMVPRPKKALVRRAGQDHLEWVETDEVEWVRLPGAPPPAPAPELLAPGKVIVKPLPQPLPARPFLEVGGCLPVSRKAPSPKPAPLPPSPRAKATAPREVPSRRPRVHRKPRPAPVGPCRFCESQEARLRLFEGSEMRWWLCDSCFERLKRTAPSYVLRVTRTDPRPSAWEPAGRIRTEHRTALMDDEDIRPDAEEVDLDWHLAVLRGEAGASREWVVPQE